MYETISSIAGTWGLLFLLLLFIGAVAYALWPSNRAKFKRAKQLPLEDEELTVKGDKQPDDQTDGEGRK